MGNSSGGFSSWIDFFLGGSGREMASMRFPRIFTL